MRDIIAIILTIVVAIVIARVISARVSPHFSPIDHEYPPAGNPTAGTGNPILDYVRMRYPNAVV